MSEWRVGLFISITAYSKCLGCIVGIEPCAYNPRMSLSAESANCVSAIYYMSRYLPLYLAADDVIRVFPWRGSTALGSRTFALDAVHSVSPPYTAKKEIIEPMEDASPCRFGVSLQSHADRMNITPGHLAGGSQFLGLTGCMSSFTSIHLVSLIETDITGEEKIR